MVHSLPLDLVRVRLLELLTTDETLELAALARATDDGSVHLLLLVGGKGASRLGRLLLVVSVLVTPLDVLRRRLLEVLLDVVEGVLGDVGDAEVGVLLDASDVGEGLAGEELDEGRLSGSVGTDCEKGVSEKNHDDGGGSEDVPIPTREERETAHETSRS